MRRKVFDKVNKVRGSTASKFNELWLRLYVISLQLKNKLHA
jgi:hypothetical protein